MRLPFLPEFEDAIRSGRKILTARTRRCPEGIYETPFDFKVRITGVVRLTLRGIRTLYWRGEGCESPEDFERVWVRLHPRAGFRPEQIVYLHQFQLVDEEVA